MRSSPPLPPISARMTEDVLEELCISLRKLALSTRHLPYSGPPDIESEAAEVKGICAELAKRGVDPTSRLATLTIETGWLMESLHSEALGYPNCRPWVRDAKDGIRLALRCEVCEEREFPATAQRISLCDQCLDVFQLALMSPTDTPRMLLYRSFTPAKRCEHATNDTVLGVYPWPKEWTDEFDVGFCVQCIEAERCKRAA
jgi:hypothetical protein